MEKISSKICLNTKRKNSFSSFFCKHFFLFVLVTIILWGGVAILPAAARTTPQIISDCKKQSSVQSTINDCVSAAVNAENPVNSAWKDGLKVAGKVVVKGIDTMAGLATMPQYLVLSAWLLIISGIANTFLFLVAMIFDAFFFHCK